MKIFRRWTIIPIGLHIPPLCGSSKYISFYLTILLPGTYVAVGVHHPELLPHALLRKVMEAEASTPFPLMFEALLIQLIYELMREAGLRLPRPVGHAIGIVGALVIGDAAVSAGLIGTPMVLIVALTAISSFVVPSLYDSVTVLKFLFILAGGIFGLFGITLGVSALLLNLCSVTVGGVPTTAPATPFNPYSLRDMFLRAGWKFLGKYVFHIEDVPAPRWGTNAGCSRSKEGGSAMNKSWISSSQALTLLFLCRIFTLLTVSPASPDAGKSLGGGMAVLAPLASLGFQLLLFLPGWLLMRRHPGQNFAQALTGNLGGLGRSASLLLWLFLTVMAALSAVEFEQFLITAVYAMRPNCSLLFFFLW